MCLRDFAMDSPTHQTAIAGQNKIITEQKIGKIGQQGGAKTTRASITAVRLIAERVIDLLYLAFFMMLSVAWVERVMAAFPYTEPYSNDLSEVLWHGLSEFGLGIVGAIPGLIIVCVIFFFCTVVVQAGNSVIDQLARLRVGWLDAETAAPTRRILTIFIWIFALVLAYPHLPGADSDAFKGISVLLGLMVSLGASSIVGQAASGLIVLYTRVLKPDEWVTIGETEGKVERIGMFTTEVVLRSGERVSVPNVKIIQDRVVNHSRADEGQQISADITIGYDTPWAKVHEMLLAAARETAGVADKPAPFVLQTALNDFYVAYSLRAQAADPSLAPQTLSALHATIQDVFARNGEQIMSPHFRDMQGDHPLLPPTHGPNSPPLSPNESDSQPSHDTQSHEKGAF